MNTLKHYFPVGIEFGILLKNTDFKKNAKNHFENLIKIQNFDGVNKYDAENNEMLLTSANNELSMYANNYDLRLKYLNSEMVNEIELSKIDNFIKLSIDIAQEFKVPDLARVIVRQISTSKSDKIALANLVIKPQLTDKLNRSFEIDFDFSSDNTTHYITVSTNHTIELHGVFESKGLKQKLKQLSMIESRRYFDTENDISKLEDFVKTQLDKDGQLFGLEILSNVD